MSHHHHHHYDPATGVMRLTWAVAANIMLSVVQIAGGVISGSLSLIADALHNFSDAASLLLALVAIKIGGRPSDNLRTFGYRRAEIVAALINLTALSLIGFYLIMEAIQRFYAPEPIAGWTVILVAAVALIVDLFTAFLTWRQSKTSVNIRAAFLHNISDAMASVGVIIAGTLILLYGWVWTDAAITLLIAGYVIWQGFTEMPKVIHILMEGTPESLNFDVVIAAMKDTEGVQGIHHVHIWKLDEHKNALEAHVVVGESSLADIEVIKARLKSLLHERFEIGHSTLEIEIPGGCGEKGACH